MGRWSCPGRWGLSPNALFSTLWGQVAASSRPWGQKWRFLIGGPSWAVIQSPCIRTSPPPNKVSGELSHTHKLYSLRKSCHNYLCPMKLEHQVVSLYRFTILSLYHSITPSAAAKRRLPNVVTLNKDVATFHKYVAHVILTAEMFVLDCRR